MKMTELAELILVVLHDRSESGGYGQYLSLGDIAAEFGENDPMKVREAARLLRDQGLVHAVFTDVSSSARIMGPGIALVEEGGRTGIIEKYRQGLHSPSAFPPYPGSSLKREDVVNYLLQCKANGWCQGIYQGSSPNEFIIVTDDDRKILLQGQPQGCVVLAEHLGSQTKIGLAESIGGLEKLISQAGNINGGQWPTKITSARLSSSTPASNMATMSSLVGTSEIQAVFDPYLSNKSLATLLDILSLGPTISNNVRLLACQKMTTGVRPQLTKTFADLWFHERAVTGGEVRIMPDGEHRRFMLLSGGNSLILGMSLNSIAKNEAVRLEQDVQDYPFFDSVWNSATPLV
jgi:hypothetical protein